MLTRFRATRSSLTGLLLVLLLLSQPALAQVEGFYSHESNQVSAEVESPLTEEDSSEYKASNVHADEDRSFGYRLLMYLPNRVLDLFDIVRLRARVGPGIGVGLRATKLLSADLASYKSVYIGLPGPRRSRGVTLPFGIEQYNGLGIDAFEPETNKQGPDYAQSEIGIDAQLFLVGAAVSIDYKELVDFFTGFVGYEVVRDDI